MWPWLQNEHFKKNALLTERQQFLGQLCLFALVAHLVILGIAIFFSGRTRHKDRFVVSTQKRSTVYVLTPYKKQAQQSKVRGSTISSSKASKVINYQTYQQLQKQKKSGLKIKKKTKQSKSSVSATKMKKKIAEKKISPVIKKNNQEQAVLAKPKLAIVNVEVVETIDPVKKRSLKKHTPENVPVEKTVPKIEPKVEALKSEPIVVEQVPKDLPDSIKKEAKLAETDGEEIEQELEDIDLDDVTFIDSERWDSLEVQHKIQQKVQASFKSPIGIGKDVSCECTVLVGQTGKSSKVTVIKSSGIRVYDISVRAMLTTIEFPKEVWNRTITIVVGQ